MYLKQKIPYKIIKGERENRLNTHKFENSGFDFGLSGGNIRVPKYNIDLKQVNLENYINKISINTCNKVNIKNQNERD